MTDTPSTALPEPDVYLEPRPLTDGGVDVELELEIIDPADVDIPETHYEALPEDPADTALLADVEPASEGDLDTSEDQ